MDTTFTKVVIFTDALSVLQALEAEDTNPNDLSTSLSLLCQEAAEYMGMGRLSGTGRSEGQGGGSLQMGT